MPSAVPLVRVVRSGLEESVHLGHVAVCDADGRLVAAAGDPNRLVFARSSMKPLQAAVSIRRIPADARRRSRRRGVRFPQRGVRPRARRPPPAACRRRDRVHASGALRRSRPAPRTRCGRGGHGASSTTARASTPRCSRRASVRAGLSRPTSSPAIRSSARSCERCARRRASTSGHRHRRVWRPGPRGAALGDGDPVRASCRPERSGCPRAHGLPGGRRDAGTPVPGRRDRPERHQLMASVPGVVSKVGAEALHCAAVLDEGIGVAVKIADGGDRATGSALVHALSQLGAISEEELGLLSYVGPAAGARRRAPRGRDGR